jgi:germination protein M
MKKIMCLILVLAIAVLSGCKIPIEEINDANGLEGLDVNKEIEDKDDESVAVKGAVHTEEPEGSKDEEYYDELEDPDEYIYVTVYYKDGDNLLVPLTRRIKKEEGIAKAALGCMVGNGENSDVIKDLGLYTVLPEGTLIRGMNIKDGTAIVDFNSNILNYEDVSAEKNIVAGIVYCLTEFSTIKGVKFQIDGREQESLKFGTDVSKDLSRENVLINSDKVNLAEKVKKVDIYRYKYLDEKYEYILPFSIEYIGVEEEKLPAEIIRMLAVKPEDQKITTQIPDGTELIGSRIDNSILVLDFNKKIKSYGGSAREAGILNQILYTMKQIKGIDRVKILIEGKEDSLPEGTDLSKEIVLPMQINKKDII